MSKCWYESFDPLLSESEAQMMVALCERVGSYGMYSEEPTFEGIGHGLPARWDAVRNFLKSAAGVTEVSDAQEGLQAGNSTSDSLEKLAARTNYFRESYAYGDEVVIDGIEPFLHHEGFIEAARKLHGRPIIEPAIVFANLIVPGQQLAIHTDVPEFRGVNRKNHPQWLIVAMHHSRLFEDWRMPIATGVSWFHDCRGGEFAFYPNGPDMAPEAHQVRFNTALLLDTDSIFHGVDRVAETGEPVDKLRSGQRLTYEGDHNWSVRDGDETVTKYKWDDLRFSVSWKAYCFESVGDRDRWRAHEDDLSVDFVVDRMVDDLRRRDIIPDTRPADNELVEILIDSYIGFPAPRLN